jgi:CheY-like chemotaxis protein
MVLRPDVQLLLAETGEAGLALAAEHWPDLIVLDMQLPDLHGTEVFARLRADAVTASIPCIALSANVFSEDITSALDLGFADYWTKPLDLATFQQTLEAVFGPSPVAWLWSAHTLQGARREREQ